MAQLQTVTDRNQPKLGEEVEITLKENSLFLCKVHPTIWIHLKLNREDKLYLLKTLLKDFLG